MASTTGDLQLGTEKLKEELATLLLPVMRTVIPDSESAETYFNKKVNMALLDPRISQLFGILSKHLTSTALSEFRDKLCQPFEDLTKRALETRFDLIYLATGHNKLEVLKDSDKKKQADTFPRSRASSEASTDSFERVQENLLVPEGSSFIITSHPEEPGPGALQLTAQLLQVIAPMPSLKSSSSQLSQAVGESSGVRSVSQAGSERSDSPFIVITPPLQSQSRRLSTASVASAFSEGVIVSEPDGSTDSPTGLGARVDEPPAPPSLNIGEGSLVLGPKFQSKSVQAQLSVESILPTSAEKKETDESASLKLSIQGESGSGQEVQLESPDLSDEEMSSDDSDAPKSEMPPAKASPGQISRGNIPSALLDPNARLQQRSKSVAFFVEPVASQSKGLSIKYYSPQVVSGRLSQSALPPTGAEQALVSAVRIESQSRRSSTTSNISGFSDFENFSHEHSPKEKGSSPYQPPSSLGEVPSISSSGGLTESDLVTSGFGLPSTWGGRIAMSGLNRLGKISGFLGITTVTNPKGESSRTNLKNKSSVLVSHTGNPSGIPVGLNLPEIESVAAMKPVASQDISSSLESEKILKRLQSAERKTSLEADELSQTIGKSSRAHFAQTIDLGGTSSPFVMGTPSLSRRLSAKTKTDSPTGVRVEVEFPNPSHSLRSKAEKKESTESDSLKLSTQEDVLAALPVLHLTSRRQRSTPRSSHSMGNSPILGSSPVVPKKGLSQLALPQTGLDLTSMPKERSGSQSQSRRNSASSNISGFSDFENVSNEHSPKEGGDSSPLQSPPEPIGLSSESNLIIKPSITDQKILQEFELLQVDGEFSSSGRKRSASQADSVRSSSPFVEISPLRSRRPSGISVGSPTAEKKETEEQALMSEAEIGPQSPRSSVGSNISSYVHISREHSPKDDSPHQPPSPLRLGEIPMVMSPSSLTASNLVASGLSEPQVATLVVGGSQHGSDDLEDVSAVPRGSQASSINNSPVLASQSLMLNNLDEQNLLEAESGPHLEERKTLSETQEFEADGPRLPRPRTDSVDSNSQFVMIEPSVRIRSQSQASNQSDGSFVGVELLHRRESITSQKSDSGSDLVHVSRDNSPTLTTHPLASTSGPLTQELPAPDTKTRAEQLQREEEARARAESSFNQHRFALIRDVRARLQTIQAIQQSVSSLGIQDEEAVHYQRLLSQAQREAEMAISIAKKRFEECSFIPEQNMQLRQSALLDAQSNAVRLRLTDDQRQVYTALLSEALASITASIEQEQRQQEHKHQHDQKSQHDQVLAVQFQAEEFASEQEQRQQEHKHQHDQKSQHDQILAAQFQVEELVQEHKHQHEQKSQHDQVLAAQFQAEEFASVIVEQQQNQVLAAQFQAAVEALISVIPEQPQPPPALETMLTTYPSARAEANAIENMHKLKGKLEPPQIHRLASLYGC